ncbi:hypothetical protein NE557_08135, partial [Bifidobacterium animalis]
REHTEIVKEFGVLQEEDIEEEEEGEEDENEKNHEDDFGLEDELIRPKVVKDIFQEDDDNEDSQAREDTFIRKRPKRRKVIRRLRDNDPETETAGFERDV